MVLKINNHRLTTKKVLEILYVYKEGTEERKALKNLYTLLMIKEKYTPNEVVDISVLKKIELGWIKTAESALMPYL